MKKILCAFIAVFIQMTMLSAVLAYESTYPSDVNFYKYTLSGETINGCSTVSVDSRISPETAEIIIQDLLHNNYEGEATTFTYPFSCPVPGGAHDMYWYKIYYHDNDFANEGQCLYEVQNYDQCGNSGCTFSILESYVTKSPHATGSYACNNAVVPISKGELQIVFAGH